MLYVRREERQHKGEGVMLAGVRDGVIYTIFVPEGSEIDGELVNDTAGRTEAQIHYLEREVVECERDAMMAAMMQAVDWLSPSQAADLRSLYIKKRKALEIQRATGRT